MKIRKLLVRNYRSLKEVFLDDISNLTILMADSVIAATSLFLNAMCISDDHHLKAIKEIKTKWI